jgi:hypothetical protein
MRIRFIFGLLVIVAIGCGFAGCDDSSSSAAPSAIQPTVVSIQPASGPIGSLVTVRGSGFADQNNTVKFGTGYIRGLRSTADGTMIQFAVPEGLDLCPPTAAGPCQGAFPAVTTGNYEVTVIADGTKSASFTFTVTK